MPVVVIRWRYHFAVQFVLQKPIKKAKLRYLKPSCFMLHIPSWFNLAPPPHPLQMWLLLISAPIPISALILVLFTGPSMFNKPWTIHAKGFFRRDHWIGRRRCAPESFYFGVSMYCRRNGLQFLHVNWAFTVYFLRTFSTFTNPIIHLFYRPKFCIIIVCNFSWDMKMS